MTNRNSPVTVLVMTPDGEPLFEQDVDTQMSEFLAWWIKTACNDYARTVPKIEEYGTGALDIAAPEEQGSSDLRAIGDIYAELLGWPVETASAVKQELAAWTYLVGKLGRCIANYRQANPAKEDTIFDACIYIMMMRRLQETGQWP